MLRVLLCATDNWHMPLPFTECNCIAAFTTVTAAAAAKPVLFATSVSTAQFTCQPVSHYLRSFNTYCVISKITFLAYQSGRCCTAPVPVWIHHCIVYINFIWPVRWRYSKSTRIEQTSATAELDDFQNWMILPCPDTILVKLEIWSVFLQTWAKLWKNATSCKSLKKIPRTGSRSGQADNLQNVSTNVFHV